MKIIISAIGKINTKDPHSQMIADYLKRLPWKITMKEYNAGKNTTHESELLLSDIPADYKKILLDEHGKTYSSEEFAQALGKLRDNGHNIAFILGGASGHTEKIKQQADLLLSLGSMTLPHLLARVILVEQLYRGSTILSGHPYHRK